MTTLFTIHTTIHALLLMHLMVRKAEVVKVHPVSDNVQLDSKISEEKTASSTNNHERKYSSTLVNPIITIRQEPVYGPPRISHNAAIVHHRRYDGSQDDQSNILVNAAATEAAASNPLLAALLLSSTLGLPVHPPGYNHPQHLSINPYVALLLSHYGRYLSIPPHIVGHGIYGYTAANNLHNNKPFGSYKIAFDKD